MNETIKTNYERLSQQHNDNGKVDLVLAINMIIQLTHEVDFGKADNKIIAAQIRDEILKMTLHTAEQL